MPFRPGRTSHGLVAFCILPFVFNAMPQHCEVDPKNLGISPEDEAIQEFVDQATPAPDEKNLPAKNGDDEADETDEHED